MLPENAPVDLLDLWLLEAALELPTPLQLLVSPDPAGSLNMRDDPRFSHEELCERLAGLAERDLIRIHEHPDGMEELFTPEAISQAILRPRPRSIQVYELTPSGGALWETQARPDWSRYVNAGEEPSANDAPESWVIEAVSLDIAEAEFRFHEELGDGNRPVPESKRGEALTPWNVTYWKTLPRGYRLHYTSVPQPPDPVRTAASRRREPWYTPVRL
ncbi:MULTISPECIES: hypothetical protein [unclassified Myxococcus]|uniref:hypothetical protein n=1 Tax=unclassified Myxococcus TaxID=2648731 RepID=UPI0020C6AF4B|nr:MULTISPECIES: hypothetical protein [unclassified Myxococcus]